MISVGRGVIGAAGIGAGVYGALKLADQGWDNFLETGKWLVGGVVLHDGVLGPAVVVLAVVAGLLLRGRIPAAVVVGAIVLATVTITAVPVLGKPGEKPDNPSLLPRDYTAGWLVFAAIVLLTVAVAVLLDRRSTRGGGRGTSTGRR